MFLWRLESSVQKGVCPKTPPRRGFAAAVGWESSLRKEHQDKSKEQGLLLVDLRGTVNGQYVEPDLENLGLQAVDVREPMTVARRSLLISDRFEVPNLAKMLGQSHLENPVTEPIGVDPISAQGEETSQKV